ncbi:hypothetical protein [Sphingobacterium paucimobilis]|uniref:Uncharacterized protein n=1 Tax=Sphingobacterium paucimobilis HER1398 TaxID=1346330 RepID=U2J5F5_9SPHI|nr:hypothetical protein [Sphingobacterium paucimobilis]ERJ60159.1 hypothetical protein M472_15455 [Sphingobacterium paucimobilis HER1398]
MKGSLTLVLLFYIISYSYGQTDTTKKMIYDKENAMYYRITNDDKYLYLNFYKDEYAAKVVDKGGIKLFFNIKGEKDTVNMPNMVYPVFKYPKKDFELIEIKGFSGVPDGQISVYNEFGITAEAKYIAREGKSEVDRNKYVFESKVSIPLELLGLKEQNRLSVMIFLRGMRLVALPQGRVSPVSESTSFNSNSDVNNWFLNMDTWTHSWVDYELK